MSIGKILNTKNRGVVRTKLTDAMYKSGTIKNRNCIIKNKYTPDSKVIHWGKSLVFDVEKDNVYYDNVPRGTTYLVTEAYNGCKNLDWVKFYDTPVDGIKKSLNEQYDVKPIYVYEKESEASWDDIKQSDLTSYAILCAENVASDLSIYTTSGVEVNVQLKDDTSSEIFVIPEKINNLPVNLNFSNTTDNENRCSGMKRCVIPNGVTRIGQKTFYGCKSLSSITIPNTITSIGRASFEHCHGLSQIILPDSITSIEPWAFNNCINVSSIKFSKKLSSITERCFANCLSLSELTIPSWITSIETHAFYEGNFTKLDFTQSNVENIEQNAFVACDGVTELYLPSTLTSIGYTAFWALDGRSSNDKYPNKKWSLSIDMPIIWDDFRRIIFNYGEKRAFTKLSSLYILENTKTISNDAFVNINVGALQNLPNLYIGSGVTSIGDNSFYNCNQNCNIVYNGTMYDFNNLLNGRTCGFVNGTIIHCLDGDCIIGVQYIRDFPELNYPDSIPSIENFNYTITNGYANITSINNSDYLTALVIPQYIDNKPVAISYDEYVVSEFNEQTNSWEITRDAPKYSQVKNITMPNSIVDIGDYRFYTCNNLTSIKFSSNLTSIGMNAFRECNSLTTLSLPESLKYIGTVAFYNCKKLDSIVIPKNVSTIEPLAFYGCQSVKNIDIQSNLTKIEGSTFRQCYNLTSLNIPNSVTSIGNSAFDGCRKITSLNLHEGVEIIEDSAFNECGELTSLTLPSTIQNIGIGAFSYCPSTCNVVANFDSDKLLNSFYFISQGLDENNNVIEIQNNSYTRLGFAHGTVIHCLDGDVVYPSTEVVAKISYNDNEEPEISVIDMDTGTYTLKYCDETGEPLDDSWDSIGTVEV